VKSETSMIEAAAI